MANFANCRYLSVVGGKQRNKALHSGLQKEVIALYRKILRTCHAKDKSTKGAPDTPFLQSLSGTSTETTLSAMRTKFRKHSGELSSRDHLRIEHHIRQGKKYIKMLNMEGIVSMKSS